MNAIELLDIINTGETSKVQFKETMPHPDSIAAEMSAFSNTMGGMILFGIKDKTGEIIGLSYEEIQKYSQDIGNYATNNIVPGIYVKTEVVPVDYNGEKKILIIYVDEGINKPYKDLNRDVWVKQGSDKRRVTDNAEMLRLFQQGSHLLADEIEVYDTSIVDINPKLFRDYFEKENFKVKYFIEDLPIRLYPFYNLLKNIGLIKKITYVKKNLKLKECFPYINKGRKVKYLFLEK